MRFVLPLALLAFGLGSIAPQARADTAAYQASQLAKFEKYAGAPVREFPMVNMWKWQVVGPEKLVVWPKINTAYLLTVAKPCVRLQWTNALGVSQVMSMKVTKTFDYVAFEHQRCKILKIQPIDRAAMRKAEKAAKGRNGG